MPFFFDWWYLLSAYLGLKCNKVSSKCNKIYPGERNLFNFELIKDGTINGLSSTELDVLAAVMTEKTLDRNSNKYPDMDN